jgi:hypothetical protein
VGDQGRDTHGEEEEEEEEEEKKKKEEEEESRFWGVFVIAVHRAFVLGLGARHRGIVELSEGG